MWHRQHHPVVKNQISNGSNPIVSLEGTPGLIKRLWFLQLLSKCWPSNTTFNTATIAMLYLFFVCLFVIIFGDG